MSEGLDNSHTLYYGKNGIITEDPGTLVTDRTGLCTCTATFKIRLNLWSQLPNVGAGHPIFDFILMEKRELVLKGPWAIATCSYAGVAFTDENGPEGQIVYELCSGVSEEPIETHPDFDKKIGGTPMAPENGANFRNIADGSIANKAKKASTNDGYVFENFDLMVGAAKNDFAKIESYLEAGQLTWKKTWAAKASAEDLSNVGRIERPPGGAPRLPAKSTWLNMGITSTKRGSAYTMVQEWRASGRRGWNERIY